MSDPPSTSPPADTPGIRAMATVGEVVGDLVRLCERLPLTDPAECQSAGELLDQLSLEIAQAAAFVRAGAIKPAIVVHHPPGWITS